MQHPSSHSDSQMRWNQGLGVSTLVHLLIIGSLSLIFEHQLDRQRSTSTDTIQTRWTPTQDQQEPEIQELVPVIIQQQSPSNSALLSRLPLIADRTSAPDPESQSSYLQGPLPQATQFEESLTTKYGSDIVGALLTSTALGNGENGTDSGNGNGRFFGINPQSKKIVYVVDSSNSMNFPHESEGKTRLGRVKLELARAIHSMDEDQQFFVIFFSDMAIPMPARALQPATNQAKKKYLNWVARVPGIGTTEPYQALLLALSLQPDTIYFLTDGQFDPVIVKSFNKVAAQKYRNQKVTVNGICFGSLEGEQTIRELAENNSGTFTFIP
ncbi:vWA domain-containing protein [Gimesia maris]|uniref:vWA domain-containing protein n=1 Tax=Gimesia maris TaxID=122 RepID=UPI0032F06A0A